MQAGSPEDISGYEQKSSWDVAVRYQDLKKFGHIPDKEKQRLKARAIQGVIAQAQAVVGPVWRPQVRKTIDISELRSAGVDGELNLSETLEAAYGSGDKSLLAANSLRFDAALEKNTTVALVMDASLSMTGEKIALLAVAAAVVALSVPSEHLVLMGFDSKVRWIKKYGNKMSLEKIVEGVLELPAGGFTNLEIALEEISAVLNAPKLRRANVILITDGKYTEGRDPTSLARRFKRLNVLKIGRDQAGRGLLKDLVRLGNGSFFEARKMNDLPKTMYAALRTLLR
ncbi:MAG TPA: vWA domain-containing protein [Oligoflexia bacterium]|nr:vWA domain-containing protein [Oligoflexia bacterium]